MGNEIWTSGRTIPCEPIQGRAYPAQQQPEYADACLPQGYQYSGALPPQGYVIPSQGYIVPPQQGSHQQSTPVQTLESRLHLNGSEQIVTREELSKFVSINEKTGTINFKMKLDPSVNQIEYSHVRANGQGDSTRVSTWRFGGSEGSELDGEFRIINNQQVFVGQKAYELSYKKETDGTVVQVKLDANQMEAYRITAAGTTFIIKPQDVRSLIEQQKNAAPPAQITPPGAPQNPAQTPPQTPTQNPPEVLSERDKNRPADELKRLDDAIAKVEGFNKLLQEKPIEPRADKLLSEIVKMEKLLSPKENGRMPTLGPGVKDAILGVLDTYYGQVKESLKNDPEQLDKALKSLLKIKEYLHANHGGNPNSPTMPNTKPGQNGANIPGLPPAGNGANIPGLPPGSNGGNIPGLPPRNNGANIPGLPPAPNGNNIAGLPPGSNGANIPGLPPRSNGADIPGLPPNPTPNPTNGGNPLELNPSAPTNMNGSNISGVDPNARNGSGIAGLAPNVDILKRDEELKGIISSYYAENSKATGAFNVRYDRQSGSQSDHALNQFQKDNLDRHIRELLEKHGGTTTPALIKNDKGEFYCFFGKEGTLTILDRSSLHDDVNRIYHDEFRTNSGSRIGKWGYDAEYGQSSRRLINNRFTKVDFDGNITQVSSPQLDEKGRPTGPRERWKAFDVAEVMNETRSSNINQSSWSVSAYDLNDAYNRAGFKKIDAFAYENKPWRSFK